MGRARTWAAMLGLGAVVVGPATPLSFAQDKEPELYELVPADRQYPFVRVCSTPEGICMLPLYERPGAPCSCRRSDGSMVSGVCTH
jgi:hypothetical protein